MSKYPVGATWEAVDKYGMIGKIWLDKRIILNNKKVYEVWKWSHGYDSDWGSNYRFCREEIAMYMANDVRFKRVLGI